MIVSFCFSCSDAIVSQVLDELGLNLSDELSSEKLLHMLPFCHLVTCVPFLTSTVDCRSSEHRRKLVSSSRKEGRAPGCSGWCRRRSGGATEQPQERLTAVTAAEDVNKNILESRQLVSFQRRNWHNICCLSCVLRQCGFLFAAFSFTELIIFNQILNSNLQGLSLSTDLQVSIFSLSLDFAKLSESDCQCKY